MHLTQFPDLFARSADAFDIEFDAVCDAIENTAPVPTKEIGRAHV